jgi:hypothetical protein
VSFESEFEAEVASEFGDLGPAEDGPAAGGGDDRPRRNRRRR